MSGSVYGNIFKVSTWGESHGRAVGAVVDGCPAGIPLSAADVQRFLNRRKPGQSRYATPRREDDAVEILSGIFEGRTTGTPISMIVYNKTQRSEDYSEIASYYRPGHADYTFDAKYGFRDYRGGGRSSGRETIGRVAAGAVACALLGELGIRFLTYTASIGDVSVSRSRFDEDQITQNPLYMPDAQAAGEAAALIEAQMREGDSVGGTVACVIKNVPAGIGEPVFDKLDAALARAMFSIGAVKGFEIGDGFKSAASFGSQNNDAFIRSDAGISKATNHAGGILGGISDGSDIWMRVAIKPTPSIAMPQHTVGRDGQPLTVEISGRHDPVIVPRAVVVVESMAALTLADLILSNLGARIENVKKIYGIIE